MNTRSVDKGPKNLTLYLTGGITHIGLGLEVLDASGRPIGITMWDYGSRNHYSYKDEEWITGKKHRFGSLNNLSLLAGTTEGEMRAWDPTKRFDMSLEAFINCEKVRAKLPISMQQRQFIHDWLYSQTQTFQEHHNYPEQDLNIWFNGGVPYNMYRFNCATFIGEALFVGEVFTKANFRGNSGQTEPRPVRWLYPPNLLRHFVTNPLLVPEVVEQQTVKHKLPRGRLVDGVNSES